MADVSSTTVASGMRRLGLLIMLLALCAAVPALAAERMEVTHVSDGGAGLDPPADARGDVARDGSVVVILTEERLLAADEDAGLDLYFREVATGRTVLATPSLLNTVELHLATVSADARTAVLQTETQLLDTDEDYEHDYYVATMDGALHLASPDAQPGDSSGVGSAHLSADGSRFAFLTGNALLAGDTDTKADIYTWTADDGLALVSDDASGETDPETHAGDPMVSDDGSTVGFGTGEALDIDDENGTYDAYIWRPGSAPQLATDETLPGLGGSRLGALSSDGERALVLTEQIHHNADDDTYGDLYLFHDGAMERLVSDDDDGSPDAESLPELACATPDLQRIVYSSVDHHPGDGDDEQVDVFSSTTAGLERVSSFDTAFGVYAIACSHDATHVLVETRAPLATSDTVASSIDAYLLSPGQPPRLVTDPEDEPLGGPMGDQDPNVISGVVAPDGQAVTFGTLAMMAPEDTDDQYDLFRWTPAAGVPSLLSALAPASWTLLPDASGALIRSSDSGAATDTDSAADLYLLRMVTDPPVVDPIVTPVPDTVAPVLGSLALEPRRPRAGRKARLRFTSTEAGTFTVKVRRQRPGRRRGGKCVKAKKGKRCKRYVAAGSKTGAMTAGSNTVVLRIKKRGRHRLTLAATDAAGNRSAPARLTVKVRRRKG